MQSGKTGPGRARFQKIKEKSKLNKQLYVMPCFLKPGKQTFVIQSLMFQQEINSTKSGAYPARLST